MKTGMYGLKFAVAICVVASATAVLAQGQGRRGGFGGGFGGRGGFGNDPTTLLGIEAVQTELSLSPEQKTQVQKVTDDAQQARRDLFQSGAAPEEMQTKMQDLAKANKKKVDEILLAPQRDRLDQIGMQLAIQMGGPAAFTRPEVADKLGLKDDQKQKIQTIADETNQKRQEIFQNANGDFQAAQEQSTKLNTEAKDKAVAVLDGDQKKKLETLMGKEFKIDPMQLFRGGGFGGRRGGPGA